MTAATAGEPEIIDLHGVKVEIRRRGAGRDILWLPGGAWFGDEAGFDETLARLGRVVTPVHPGFGAIDAPPRFNCADDLAYLYLDLVARLGMKNALVVGAGFGGWIAAEIATKTCADVGALVLIDPVGVRTGERTARDIADIFAIADPDLKTMAWADASRFNDRTPALDDAELTRRVRARVALARYGWQPYMHNPKLNARLRRVAAPTLFLWGARDRIVTPDYGRKYAALVPGARFSLIDDAGHFPHVEQPSAVIDAIASFVRAEGATR